jgi:hypothetical protein
MFGVKSDKRMTAKDAGYMELAGAVKSGECDKVRVEAGVSRELGCCNLFQPAGKDTNRFSCGTCEYVQAEKEKSNVDR